MEFTVFVCAAILETGGRPLESYRKIPDGNLNDFIDSFISTQVIGRGLDERTEKAYRLDLEHFYKWLESSERQTS